jgi:cellulose synthase/poly-beta-1,6-N-acetylglucosamine synthase-like glycosyltransferase
MIVFYLFLAISIISFALYVPELLIVFYFGRKRKTNTEQKMTPKNLPTVSIVLPVYNEESLIKPKMENMLQLSYPKELLEIIIVDGNSHDRTPEIVRTFCGDRVKLIEQKVREGVTDGVKRGVSATTGEIIVMTDAEALFDPDAIRLLVENFEDPSVGAISGRQVLVNPKINNVTMMETAYRNFHERMRAAESRLYSTSHFKGELVAVRRDLFPFDMSPTVGALDRGIAFNVIRKGFRAIIDDRAVFQDISTEHLKDRNRQKVQRGTLLQENILQNRDMLFGSTFNKFGGFILPSNFLVYIIFPIVFVVALVLAPFGLLDLYLYSPLVVYIVLAGLLALFVPKRIRSFVFVFFHSQFMLLIGLKRIAISGKPKYIKQVEGTRKIRA